MVEEAALVVLGAALGAGVWWLSRTWRGGPSAASADHFTDLQRHVTERLDRVTEQLDQRLRENVRAMNESKSFLAERASTTERTVREVSAGLGKLEQATAALQRTNDEIASFQQMLKSPKIRGSFGEVLLTNLLGEVLPAEHYMTQYTFPGSGEIADAVVRLQDGYVVAIDAKFPLANYEAYVTARDTEQRAGLRRAFLKDVKKHIDDIARKYIVPQEKTLELAFMYIPLEGVYYETMVHDPSGESLWEYCTQRKVIPVSPNSLFSYLQTVLIGLRGLKIQQQAQEILRHLGQLRRDFGQFSEDFSTVGKHLTNAKNRFDDSARRLDKFSNRLDQIETQTPVLPEEAPSQLP